MGMTTQQLGFNTASLAGMSLQEAVETGRRIGVGSLELLGFDGQRHSQGTLAGFWFDRLSDREKVQLRASVADFRHRSIHAPFLDVPLFTVNPEVRALAIKQMQESVRAAAYLGAQTVTVHTNIKRGFAVEEYWDEMLDTYRQLGDDARDRGVWVGVENLNLPDNADDYVRLIREIDHPNVGATIDTGHVIHFAPRELIGTAEGVARYNDILQDLAARLADKIVHIHLHDVRASDWRDHCEVGTGIIDFAPFFQIVATSGYGRAICLELEEPDKLGALERSISRAKDFLPGPA